MQNKRVLGCILRFFLNLRYMDLILFYIYIKLPLYTIGKFTRILITLGIALRQMAEGTARHTEQSLILRERIQTVAGMLEILKAGF